MRTKVDQVRTRAKDMQQQRDLQDRVHQLRATMGWALVAEKEAVRAPMKMTRWARHFRPQGPFRMARQGLCGSPFRAVPSRRPACSPVWATPTLLFFKQEVKACEEERDELALGAEHYEAKRQRAAVRPGTARPARRWLLTSCIVYPTGESRGTGAAHGRVPAADRQHGRRAAAASGAPRRRLGRNQAHQRLQGRPPGPDTHVTAEEGRWD